MYRRDGSCDGVDHPNDHGGPRFGCAELVSGLPSSTFAVVLGGPQAVPRIERRAPWLTRMIAPEDSSAPPSAAQLLSSERCRFFDQSRNRPDQLCECASDGGGICHDEGGGAPFPSRAATNPAPVAGAPAQRGEEIGRAHVWT